MIVGFDYWNTITKNVNIFTSLASALISEGHEVHIISAVGAVRIRTTEADIRALELPHTAIHVLQFESPKEAPLLKLYACQQLGVQIFFDDRKDTCELLSENGIIACQVLK